MRQFQEIMNQVIGRAIEENSEKLSQDVSYLVHDKLMKELEYLMRVSDEREEERFKRLDEVIRAYQRENQGRAEAAAAAPGRFPFFRSRVKKKKFGRNGNKMVISSAKEHKKPVGTTGFLCRYSFCLCLISPAR